jgi:glycosyltransferase involved in cell wall biosynthesis
LRQVDVVLLTKNSEYLLEKCLNSVYENVPVANLIVIDGYSTDHTLDILSKFKQLYSNVTVYQMDGSRAKARQEGIHRVSTDWFLFVDSDVLLCKDWFSKAEKNMTSGVGAVWGLNIDVIPNIKNKAIIKFQSLIARQCFKLRGGTHDTLIRREAVGGIRIPEQLHAYEDAYIIKWIEQRGYKAVVGDHTCCMHYKPAANWSFQNAISQAIVEFKCGLVYSHMFSYMLFYPVFMFYWVLQVPLSRI